MAQSQSVAKGADQGPPDGVPNQKFAALVIGSIGVVYGDIGTSPLYAFREAVNAAKATSFAGREAVFGVLSLITWALLLVVTLKYVLILLRADNKGEGGMFALMALGQSVAKRIDARHHGARHRRRVVLLRRRRHHARHLGAVGGRRLEARLAGLRSVRAPALGHHPCRPVCHAVARHGARRQILRPDHRRVVHRPRRRRPHPYFRQPRRLRLAQPLVRLPLPPQAWPHRSRRARPCLPRRHRCRSALRRSRPLRPQADPGRLVLAHPAGAAAQLLRPGRSRAGQSGGAGKPVLPALSGLGADPDGDPGDASPPSSPARPSSPAPSR